MHSLLVSILKERTESDLKRELFEILEEVMEALDDKLNETI